MAIHFMEGFGYAAAGAHPPAAADELHVNWTSWIDRTTDVTITDYENTAEGIRKYVTMPNPGHDFTARCSLPDPSSTFVVGMRVYWAGTGESCLWRMNLRCQGGVNASGEVVYSHSSNGGVAGTGADTYRTTATLTGGNWYYLEWYIEMATGATGTVRLYIDGALSREWTNVQTASTSTFLRTAFQIGTWVSGHTWQSGDRATDIYVSDGDVLGECKVWYQPCDTAGSSAQFTPSAGSNHQNVDDTGGNDGDTTYNESTTPGQADSFTHSDQVTFAPEAIQSLAWLRVSAGDQAKMRVGVRSSASDAFGDTEIRDGAISQYDQLQGPIQAVDPNTSSPWVLAAANAAETKIEHVS